MFRIMVLDRKQYETRETNNLQAIFPLRRCVSCCVRLMGSGYTGTRAGCVHDRGKGIGEIMSLGYVYLIIMVSITVIVGGAILKWMNGPEDRYDHLLEELAKREGEAK